MFDFLDKYFDELIHYFTSGEKRVSIQYWVTTLILAYYVFYKSKKNSGFFKYIFNKKVWASNSAFVDYQIFVFNIFFKLIFILPIVILKIKLSFELENWLILKLGYFPSVSGIPMIILYSITIIVFSDLMSYAVHALFHKYESLWKFHKIHHSAKVLNPITQYRLHPIELLINNIGEAIVYVLITGVFMYMNHGFIEPEMYFGVNIFSIMFFSWGASLRHSHVKLSFPKWVENIFLSPKQHQIHHSIEPKHYNKNYGSKLAIWDKIFGTIIKSKEVKRLSFGIKGVSERSYRNLFQALITPFKELFSSK